eukprot:gene9640-12979_t
MKNTDEIIQIPITIVDTLESFENNKPTDNAADNNLPIIIEDICSEINRIPKNELKRQKRAEKLFLARIHRRAVKKELKKRKREENQLDDRAKEFQVINDEIELTTTNDPIPTKQISGPSRQERKEEYVQKCKNGFSVIIDCDWEEHHNERNIKSLSQQIMFLYGCNRRHSNPANIYVTGLGSKLKNQLSKVKYEDWIGVNFSDEDYIKDSDLFGPSAVKELVYLTSDAEETLTTLDANKAYVIGGIVDRNRLKGATYNKAITQGIKTAKLPIKDFFSLSATHVLTVNHVFEILVNYAKCQSWNEALESVLPKRKGPAALIEIGNDSVENKSSTDQCNELIELSSNTV